MRAHTHTHTHMRARVNVNAGPSAPTVLYSQPRRPCVKPHQRRAVVAERHRQRRACLLQQLRLQQLSS
jgi:hypothetical protein